MVELATTSDCSRVSRVEKLRFEALGKQGALRRPIAGFETPSLFTLRTGPWYVPGIMSDMKATTGSVPRDAPVSRAPAHDVDPHRGDVDVTLLLHMLSMTPAERLDYHDAVRRSSLSMRRAGRKHYGVTGYDDIDPESAPPPDGSGR